MKKRKIPKLGFSRYALIFLNKHGRMSGWLNSFDPWRVPTYTWDDILNMARYTGNKVPSGAMLLDKQTGRYLRKWRYNYGPAKVFEHAK